MDPLGGLLAVLDLLDLGNWLFGFDLDGLPDGVRAERLSARRGALAGVLAGLAAGAAAFFLFYPYGRRASPPWEALDPVLAFLVFLLCLAAGAVAGFAAGYLIGRSVGASKRRRIEGG